MEIIENSLIPVMKDKNGDKLVDARTLYEFIESKRQFADWIKDKIDKYGFIENEDFTCISQNYEKPQGGRPTIEYILTLDTAKEIAMVENNEKGREVRRYFINIEKRYKDELLKIQDNAYRKIGQLEMELEMIKEKIPKPILISKREIDIIKILNLINELAADGVIYKDIHYKQRRDDKLFIDFRKVYKILKAEYKDIEMFKASPVTIETAFDKQSYCVGTSEIDRLTDPKTYCSKAVSGVLIDIVKLRKDGAFLDNLC